VLQLWRGLAGTAPYVCAAVMVAGQLASSGHCRSQWQVSVSSLVPHRTLQAAARTNRSKNGSKKLAPFSNARSHSQGRPLDRRRQRAASVSNASDTFTPRSPAFHNGTGSKAWLIAPGQNMQPCTLQTFRLYFRIPLSPAAHLARHAMLAGEPYVSGLTASSYRPNILTFSVQSEAGVWFAARA
jgi:hypothetical protein